MRKRKIMWIAAACVGILAFSGCGSEEQKIYAQAVRDLEAGSYEYALTGYQTSVENEVNLAESYRGIGIANLGLGNYEAAIEGFTSAMNCEKVSKSLKKDILAYRAEAEYQAGQLDNAMADCQTLALDYDMDAETYFLSGKVALSMDSYQEATDDFDQSYAADPTYERAIRIYEIYLAHDMEADGTRYLETALSGEAKDAQDHCDRGHVYYYMEDYENAKIELTEAMNQGNAEAKLLLGMVYLAQSDTANARVMFQEYVDSAAGESGKEDSSYSAAGGYNGLALCAMAEEDYTSALSYIESGLVSASGEDQQSLLFNEIVVYERQLDFTTAQQKAEVYVEMYPEDESAAKELTFLKSRTGTLDSQTAEVTEADTSETTLAEG